MPATKNIYLTLCFTKGIKSTEHKGVTATITDAAIGDVSLQERFVKRENLRGKMLPVVAGNVPRGDSPLGSMEAKHGYYSIRKYGNKR